MWHRFCVRGRSKNSYNSLCFRFILICAHASDRSCSHVRPELSWSIRPQSSHAGSINTTCIINGNYLMRWSEPIGLHSTMYDVPNFSVALYSYCIDCSTVYTVVSVVYSYIYSEVYCTVQYSTAVLEVSLRTRTYWAWHILTHVWTAPVGRVNIDFRQVGNNGR